MRLHLNKTLRAALIAAITAVGFTLPQSYADAQTLTLTSPKNGTTIGEITGSNQAIAWSEATGQLTSWQLTFDMTCTSATDPFLRIHGNNGYSAKSTTNSLMITQGFSGTLLTLSDLALNDRTPITIKFIADVDSTGASQGTGTFYLSSGDGSNEVKAKVSGVTFADSDNNASLLSGTSRIWTNGGVEKLYNISVTKLDNNVLVVSNCTWQGTEEHHSWSDAASWDVAFTSGSNATFGTAATQTVDVNSEIEAGSVTIDNAEYTFNIADGGTLTASTLSVAGKLTVTGVAGNADMVSISTLTGTGNLDVGANANVSVKALASYSGAMGVTDGGTLNLGGDIILADLTVENGTVTTTHAGGNGVVTNTLTIGQSGTFRVLGEHDVFGYNNGATKKIDMTGAEDHLATLSLEQTTVNSVTMTTNIAMHGYSAITSKEGTAGFNTYNGNITVEGVQNSIAIIDLRNAVTIDVAAEGTLSVGKFTRNGTSAPAVTKTGAGSMSITEASLLPGTLNINAGTVSIGADTTIAGLNIAADGALAVASGTTTVSGNANVVSHAIGIGAAGILNLTGTYNVSGIAADGVVSYEGSNVLGTDNGFKKTTGKVQVLNITDGGQFSQEGATINYGEAAYVLDETGAFELTGAPDYTTLSVNTESVSFSAAWNIAEAAGKAVSAVAMAANTTLNADKAGASFSLAMSGDATVNATEATTISSITGWSNNTLTITGTGVVTLPSGALTLSGTTKLDVQGKVATGKLVLNNGTPALSVAAGASLNVTGDLTPTHGTAVVNGIVNISGSLDLSNGGNSDVKLNIGRTGVVTAGGMWMAKTAGIELAEGGTYNIANMQIVGKEGGSITTSTNNVSYGSNKADFLITNATVTATGNVTLGNTLSGVDVVVADGSSLTLNTNADSVTVRNGGTFTLNEGKTVTNGITVEDGGTIAGGVDASQVGIKVGATATFNKGITDELASVTFGWDAPVQVTNNGEQTAAYSGIDDTNMRVAADVLTAEAESAVTVENQVAVEEIVNYGTGALTLTQVDKDVLDNVYSYGGPLSLQGITEVTLANLSIGAGSTVAVYTDEHATTEGTVTVSETLTAGGGTLKANLTLVGDSTLDLSLMDGGMEALTLGSTLTINTETGLVNLDVDTLRALDALKLGESLTLITALDETTLAYGQDGGYTGTWYGQMFNREGASEFEQYSLKGDFQVFSTEQGFGLTKVSNVPEPTTGTLSLLAIMALAARRRKHN